MSIIKSRINPFLIASKLLLFIFYCTCILILSTRLSYSAPTLIISPEQGSYDFTVTSTEYDIDAWYLGFGNTEQDAKNTTAGSSLPGYNPPIYTATSAEVGSAQYAVALVYYK